MILTGKQAAAGLLLAAAQMRHSVEEALTEGVELIEADAKSRIGVQQADWAPLKPQTEARKARGGYPANAPLMREGDLKNSIFSDVNGFEAVIGSTDEAAPHQENGTSTIPPRPFIAPAIMANEEKLADILGRHVVKKIGF